MKRFEVRGDHPAWGTTFTSGLVSAEDAMTEAQGLVQAGYTNITIVDHETGAETKFEGSVERVPKDAEGA